MYEELAAGLTRIEADPAIRVAILRGTGGKAFVAGTDIEQFVGFSGDDGVAYEAQIDTCVAELKRVRVPTIALVEGLGRSGAVLRWPMPAICASPRPERGLTFRSPGPSATACRPLWGSTDARWGRLGWVEYRLSACERRRSRRCSFGL
ncbi:enoyl-CoA hydratase-related protein (plasmid) [Methylobacterium oryzae CBMB20]